MALQLHTTVALKHLKALFWAVFLSACIIELSPARAEQIIMTSGEKFTSSKVWEESGKIRFNMHGLVVSVNKSDVAAIIGEDGISHPSGAPMPQSSASSSAATAEQSTAYTPPPKKQPQQPTPASPAPQPESIQRVPPRQQPTASVKTKGIGREGIDWLMTPAEIEGLVNIDKDPAYGGIDQYWRPDEKMQLGNALLDGIVYGFWRNRLYSIMMWAEGRIGYGHLRKTVFNRYGQGQKSSKVMERYIWHDPTTDRLLEFDVESNTGFFWMRSRKLDAKIKALYPNE